MNSNFAKLQRDVPISSAFRSLAVKPREERFDRRSLGVLGGVYGEVRLHADRRIRAQHRLEPPICEMTGCDRGALERHTKPLRGRID